MHEFLLFVFLLALAPVLPALFGLAWHAVLYATIAVLLLTIVPAALLLAGLVYFELNADLAWVWTGNLLLVYLAYAAKYGALRRLGEVLRGVFYATVILGCVGVAILLVTVGLTVASMEVIKRLLLTGPPPPGSGTLILTICACVATIAVLPALWILLRKLWRRGPGHPLRQSARRRQHGVPHGAQRGSDIGPLGERAGPGEPAQPRRLGWIGSGAGQRLGQ